VSDYRNSFVVGDCLAKLREIPDETFNMCVTSPPYWGLRDYGHDGQIGLEETPDEYVARLVEVFREVRRTLRDDGTLWLNLGDSYAGGAAASGGVQRLGPSGDLDNQRNDVSLRKVGDGLKPKDLVGIPWAVAFALRADGWYLRSDIIWHKPNPMPHSVKDRPTSSHEYVFLLSKSARYYYDHEAIKEPSVCDRPSGKGYARPERISIGGRGQSEAWSPDESGGMRNKRSVWTVTTKPYSGAHFACYPPELITPCILAGCPEGGIVLDPFFGSGTTGQVAEALGRYWFGIELNPDYAPLIEERNAQPSLFTQVAVVGQE